ncbi:MAG TPA: hypothetical protein VGW38_18455 [Chloroflexota bacterium]|nr:hypothetical protein [Chloroflexota bacterium]
MPQEGNRLTTSNVRTKHFRRAGTLTRNTAGAALPPGWTGHEAAQRWARLTPTQQAQVWAISPGEDAHPDVQPTRPLARAA